MGKSKDLATGASYVDTSGDTMSGDLTTTGNVGIGGDPVKDFHVRDDNSFGGGTRIVAAFSPSITNGQDAGLAFGTYSPDDYWKQGIFWERTGSYGLGHLHFANRGTADATTVSKADAKMTINANGIVTKPNQPAFMAYGSGTYTNRGTGAIEYSTAVFNQGNHYSTSTYTFTAPVNGVYHFSAGAIAHSAATASGGIFIDKNTTHLFKDYQETGTRNRTVSGTAYCAANDAISVRIESSGGGGDYYYLGAGYGWFSGHLVG